MEETKEIKGTKKTENKKASTNKTKQSKSNTTSNKKVKSETNVKQTNTKKETTNKNSQSPVHEIDAFAAISCVLGVASLVTWLYPVLGVAVAIPGLSIGIVNHETRKSYYSLLGIIMSLIGIILSIVKNFSV